MESLICGSFVRRIASYTKSSQRQMRLLKNTVLTNTERTLPNTKVILKRNFRTSSALAKVYYTKDHEWVDVDDNQVGTMGITKFAKEQLGDLVYCELPDLGAEFEIGDAMAVIESVKAASDLYAPVSGEVLERNEEVVEDVSIMNGDADVETIWLVKMHLSNSAELDGLLSRDDYKKLIEEGQD